MPSTAECIDVGSLIESVEKSKVNTRKEINSFCVTNHRKSSFLMYKKLKNKYITEFKVKGIYGFYIRIRTHTH